jgi:hypothetical protein
MEVSRWYDPAFMAAFEDAVGGYRLAVDEQFDGPELDRSRWIPHYLPQWAGRERSRARYRFTDNRLELFIAEDQEPWLPHIEGDMRVSSLQTGCFSGPLGSPIGQHRNRDEHVVVEQQSIERLVTPMFGAVELKAHWKPCPDFMVALWMIGFEDEPHRSAEICVCEIFGSEASPATTLVGVGVHPFGDETIVDDFEKAILPIDVSAPHTYAADWTPTDVTFFVDGQPVKHVDQSPQYPMQLMLNIYGFGDPASSQLADPFVVHHVRVYEPT